VSDTPGLGIDAVTGDVTLPVGLIVGTSLSRTGFDASPQAASAKSRGAAPNWLHRSFEAGHVEGEPLLCTLTFQGEKLVSASLSMNLYPQGADDWAVHSLEVERKTKEIHDTLLTDRLGPPNRRALAPGIAVPALARTLVWAFGWGQILSCYDSRMGGTTIRFLYLES
jgi:hypothetical protein